jgi:tetratricopeptide (TPR) repeat protein
LHLEGVPVRGGVGWKASVALPTDETEAVAQVTATIARQLGLKPPEQRPYRTVPAAYSAYLNARAAERLNNYDRLATDLTRAFDLDPDLAEGRCMHVGWLYGTRQLEKLEQVTTRLIDSGRLNPRQLAFMRARRAAGRGKVEDAVRMLEQITLQWPFFVDAQNALLAHRFHHRAVKNLGEVERLARRALAFFPRGEHAASRLVRAMAFRGQAEAAKQALLDVGLTPDTRLSNDIWAEVYLYAADYAQAEQRFTDALKKAPQDIYARNMRYVAQILADRCQAAASGILEDVSEYGIRNEMSQAGWVGRLGIQALVCQQDWAGAHALLGRWAKAAANGKQVAAKWTPRLLIAAGAPDTEVTQAIEAGLGQADKAFVRASLLRTLARVERRTPRLHKAVETAHGFMTAADNSRERQLWSFTHRVLSARLTALAQPDDGPAAYARLVTPWSEVRSESELEQVVEAMALRAEALEQAGRAADAKTAWSAITALDYPRIKAMDLVMIARARLKE